MANLYQLQHDLLIHLTSDDMKSLIVTRVEGGGTNYYGVYDLIGNNNIAIPKRWLWKYST